jgi:D-proline reductase (dithiol) PrdB
MPEKLTFTQRLWNRFYAIPAVAQLWARRRAGTTQELVDVAGVIPFARLRKPLTRSKVALLTTAGVHLQGQPPFDMENPDGDATYREISAGAQTADIVITHKYYDHSDADRDLNVVFPLDHFRELAARGVVGGLAPRHFGFMGHIDGELVATLNQQTAPEVAAKLRADGVDFAFLTPA